MTVKGSPIVLEWFYSFMQDHSINYSVLPYENNQVAPLIIQGTPSELVRMEEIVSCHEEDYQCDSCPVWEACHKASEQEMTELGSCSKMVWTHIETIRI